jgi:hypothetical protein
MLVGYGVLTALFGTVLDPEVLPVSKRVIVRPEGILPDPLCFRRFDIGPDGPDGDAGLERFLGVSVADVLTDMADGIANGFLEGVIG